MVAEALLGQIQAVQFTDTEIRRIAVNSARESARLMDVLAAKGTASAQLRAAQIGMANMSTQMWANVEQATKVGIGDGVWNATQTNALFDESLMAKAGIPSTYWRASMFAQADAAKQALISRKINGIGLSQAVYKNSVGTAGKLQQTINTGLSLGKSVAEIKRDVIGFIHPNTPGGASYAAQRLARSEVLNAYHTTAITNYQKSPWVHRVIWHLSGSHPRPDECNDYADNTDGYIPLDVPDKPHPNCLCYITPQVIPIDQFKANFEAGHYNSYIDKGMGCYGGI